MDVITEQLQGRGFTVDATRRASTYARLHVSTGDGRQVDVDLGVDWRRDEPVRLGVGPVLSLADAVGNKVSALYSRSEARDFLDVDAIRRSGRFTDEDLVTAAAERDPGFEVAMFAQQLTAVRRLTLRDVSSYGVTAEELEDVKTRCAQWAETLQQQSSSEPRTQLSTDQLRDLRQQQQARFPTPPTHALRPGPMPVDDRAGRPAPSDRPADPGRGMER